MSWVEKWKSFSVSRWKVCLHWAQCCVSDDRNWRKVLFTLRHHTSHTHTHSFSSPEKNTFLLVLCWVNKFKLKDFLFVETERTLQTLGADAEVLWGSFQTADCSDLIWKHVVSLWWSSAATTRCQMGHKCQRSRDQSPENSELQQHHLIIMWSFFRSWTAFIFLTGHQSNVGSWEKFRQCLLWIILTLTAAEQIYSGVRTSIMQMSWQNSRVFLLFLHKDDCGSTSDLQLLLNFTSPR